MDTAADRERALSLLTLPGQPTAADLAYHVFRRRTGWTARQALYRAGQIRDFADRMSREFDGWLRPALPAAGAVLDLGCGAGGLLVSVARRGGRGIGVDVSLEWLVVAHRMIAEAGGVPVLAAAMGEALPLRDGAVEAVISLDVIEHVGDQRRYLQEIDRVLATRGVCALATPNRYSFTPEPHIGVWGVGWLPRAWQSPYVERRTGKPYEFCTLLSGRELRHLIAQCTTMRPEISAGQVPMEEIANYSPAKRRAAHLYNRIAALPGGHQLIRPVCPFFRVIARKHAS